MFNKIIFNKTYVVLILILSFFSTRVSAATLTSSVDRYRIAIGETLNLVITLDDASFSGTPDLAGLDSSFDILNSSSSSNTRIINGSVSSKKEWRYTLSPKNTGTLLIPSFKLKDSVSEAIQIEVVDSIVESTAPNQSGDLFVELSTDRKEAYVQERITLTLRIYTAIRIARPEMQAPSLANFMVEKIGESEFQSRKNGRDYYVLEYKYALYANNSGPVTLPVQRYQISQIISNGPRGLFNIPGFDTPNTQARYLYTPEVALNIKPQPEKLPAPYWFPSEDVVISDNMVGQQTVDIGSPITRIIEIKALGNLAAHIPPLDFENIEGLKIYQEQPELNTTRAADNLLASRKDNLAIIPTRPGSYILPAIQIHWFDIKDKQFRISILPQREITVTGAVSNTQTTQTPPSSSMQTPDESGNVDSNLIEDAPIYQKLYLWVGLAILFLTLWIATLLLLLKNRSARAAPNIDETAHALSLRQSFKKVITSCASNDAHSARQAIISWAQQYWSDSAICTLSDVKRRLNDDVFSKLANELDITLYGVSESWNGKDLQEYFQKNFSNAKNTCDKNKRAVVLPKLYS